jgi:hypothetical protein
MFAYRLMVIAGRVLLTLGLCCGLLGFWLAWQTQEFLRDSFRASGEVVSYREVKDKDETRFRPKLRFSTADGSIVSFEGQMATTTERFKIGEKVPVVYNRADPQKARVALFTDNWLGATLALGIGLLAALGGIFIRKAAKRELGAQA